MNEFSVVIMAGGASSRMGTDKSFVQVNGKPIIWYVTERVADVGQAETLLVTNRPDDYAHLGLPMHADVLPDKGALGGIYTAITVSSAPYAFVVACDMPFVSPGLMRQMAALLEDAPDVVVPRVDGYPQGLFALYGKTCLPHIREKLEADRLKVIGFYDAVTVRYLDEADYAAYDPDGVAFFNVNTPQQLEQAQTYAKQQGK